LPVSPIAPIARIARLTECPDCPFAFLEWRFVFLGSFRFRQDSII
jgi:hypothetical protein